MPSGLSKAEMQKIVLTGIGAVVAMLVVFQFITVPSLRKSGELTKEISKARENLKRAEGLIANRAKLESQLLELQKKWKDYEFAFPNYSEMPDILQLISNIAGEARIKIIKLEPIRTERLQKPDAMKVEKKPPQVQAKQDLSKTKSLLFDEIPIKIEARGSYHALGAFIDRIETGRNVMSVGSLEIDSNSDDRFNHNIKLLLIAYVTVEEPAVK